MGQCSSKKDAAVEQQERHLFSTFVRPHKDSSTVLKNQCDLYFDAMDAQLGPVLERYPNYSNNIVRWEWPPGLRLTGKGRDGMIAVDTIRRFVTPTKVLERKHKFFEQQPAIRSIVKLEHANGGVYSYYHEFTFNANNEITFIEVWYSHPKQGWNQGSNRLSTRIPGLGSKTSSISMMQLRAMTEPPQAPKWTRAVPTRGDGNRLVDQVADAQTKETPAQSEQRKWLSSFVGELGVPIDAWFKSLLRTLFSRKDPVELLETVQKNKSEMEEIGRRQNVEIELPPVNDDDEDAWFTKDPTRESVLKLLHSSIPAVASPWRR